MQTINFKMRAKDTCIATSKVLGRNDVHFTDVTVVKRMQMFNTISTTG